MSTKSVKSKIQLQEFEDALHLMQKTKDPKIFFFETEDTIKEM